MQWVMWFWSLILTLFQWLWWQPNRWDPHVNQQSPFQRRVRDTSPKKVFTEWNFERVNWWWIGLQGEDTEKKTGQKGCSRLGGLGYRNKKGINHHGIPSEKGQQVWYNSSQNPWREVSGSKAKKEEEIRSWSCGLSLRSWNLSGMILGIKKKDDCCSRRAVGMGGSRE